MYISRIKLDPFKRKTAEALFNREILHGAAERTVGGERPHNMWRIEPDMSFLLLSNDIPYLGDMQEQFGDKNVKPSTKPYDGYVESIKNGDLLRFKIEVNPVICSRKYGGKNGKDIPLNLRRTEAYPFCAQDWMIKKLEENGAVVHSIQDVSHGTVYFKKNEKKNSLFTVTYTGLISVKDENSIKEAMKKGIGGKKTYGCGMLTVIKKAVRHTGTDTF